MTRTATLLAASLLAASFNAQASNPILDGNDWYMTDADWFLFQDHSSAACNDVPVYGFDGHHQPTINKWQQERLNAEGYDAGAADGVWGSKSKIAAAAFVEDNSIDENDLFEALIPSECFDHLSITVKIGSPEADVIKKFGQPKEVNTTVTRYGVSKQMVYNGMYIYTNDGVVTAWQN